MKQMTLRMGDELAARLDQRVGMVAREKWVRELVKAELDTPMHMPASSQNQERGRRDDGK